MVFVVLLLRMNLQVALIPAFLGAQSYTLGPDSQGRAAGIRMPLRRGVSLKLLGITVGGRTPTRKPRYPRAASQIASLFFRLRCAEKRATCQHERFCLFPRVAGVHPSMNRRAWRSALPQPE